MPLFDFRCQDCFHEFEELVRSVVSTKSGGSSPGVACPKCDSLEVERLLSAFAVGGRTAPASSPSRPAGPCGSQCGCFPS